MSLSAAVSNAGNELFFPHIATLLIACDAYSSLIQLQFSSGSKLPTGGRRVADVSRCFDSQLLTGRYGVCVGSGCTVTAVWLLCLLPSFCVSSKMSQRLQNLQQQNELGYQHTLVSHAILCLLMSACKIRRDIYICKFYSPVGCYLFNGPKQMQLR